MSSSQSKLIVRTFKEAIRASLNGHLPRLGAALAYYTLFAITPMFVIALAIAGMWFGEEAARTELFGQVSGLVGPKGAEALQNLLVAANKPTTGLWATFAALATLVVGATGVFVELQDSLNTLWNAKPRVGGGLWRFLKTRLLSFAMVVGIGFLLLISLVLSATLAALGKWMQGANPSQNIYWQTVNFFISLGIVTVLFALIFKVLPDVKIAWRDVWMGALLTAVLFNLGKFLLGFYLGRAAIASAYGSAGSLVIVLIWVYYSAQILFFGAKYTQIYAQHNGTDRNRKARSRA